MLLSTASPLTARVLRRVGSAETGVVGERSRLLDLAAGRAYQIFDELAVSCLMSKVATAAEMLL